MQFPTKQLRRKDLELKVVVMVEENTRWRNQKIILLDLLEDGFIHNQVYKTKLLAELMQIELLK